MREHTGTSLKKQMAIASRGSRAFTPAYRPAPPTFWRQLWAALARSTPAFSGAKLADFNRTSITSIDFLADKACTEILLPIFLFQDSRVESFARNRGHMLALTLARQREFGIEFARQIVKNYASYFATTLSLYRGTELEKANLDYFRATARALSLALTLDHLLARDLKRKQSYARAYKRRSALARARGWIRVRLLVLNYTYRRQRRANSAIEIIFLILHIVRTTLIYFLLRALDGVRLRPVMATSRRIRDKTRSFTGALRSIRELEYTLGFDETELTRGLRQILPGIDLANVDLVHAQLAGADLRSSKLSGAHLNGANLSSAFLEGAYLVRAMMQGADLTGAVLVDTNLSYADLTAADLSGANMTGANLQGVLWSELTAWPAGVSIRIRENSRQIRPGLYQVDEGGQQVPGHHAVPA